MPGTDQFCQQRTRLWLDGLWALRGGIPEPITISELREKVPEYNVPDKVVIPCLKIFSEQGLIRCFNDTGAVIENPSKESDFKQFQFTAKGARVGANYDCKKNYDL